MLLNAYLIFDGSCREAFEFYAHVLGGKIDAMFTHEGAPPDMPMPEGWKEKIMHARLSVGGDFLMGSDTPPNNYRKPGGFSVSLTVGSAEEAERIFHALSEGGDVKMPIAQTFWSPRFGMLIDRFGTPWMVNTDPALAA